MLSQLIESLNCLDLSVSALIPRNRGKSKSEGEMYMDMNNSEAQKESYVYTAEKGG